MNFFNRAIKNVTRKISKTVLLVLTFFLIGNLVIIGLSVSNAADKAKTLTRQKMRAVVTYSVDYDAIFKYTNELDQEALEEFYKNYPSIKLDYVKDLMKDERVKTANVQMNQMFYNDGSLDFVHLNNEAEQNMTNGHVVYEDAVYEEEPMMEYHEPEFFVKTNFFPNMIELIDNEFTITEGRFYSQEEIDNKEKVCLVTNAFAKVNNLTVGDTISIYIYSPDDLNWNTFLTTDDIRAEFKIIGLYDSEYQITPDNENFDWTYPYENPNNMFLMPATTLYSANMNYTQKVFDYYASMYPEDEYYKPENRPTDDINSLDVNDVTLLLSDPLDVDKFIEEYSIDLPKFMKLDANNDEFKRLSKPLDTLNLYANFIVWLVIVNAVVIITLVTALTLKTREYEIGVLLSIGASKIKVVAQFFIELAIVAILGFTLAVGTGSMISKKVGQTVLDYQIEESELNEEDPYSYDYHSIWDSDYSTDISLDDLVSEYDAGVSPLIIAEIYVVGLGIVLVSVIVPSIMIMRFNPKKILMNQY